MTTTANLDDLRAGMTGAVLDPADPAYDEARAVWNAEIDRRPVVIARCRSAADVAAAIGFGRAHGLEISVRSGAHSTMGLAVADDALMIDLSELNTVQVDPVARRARVGGGALLRDVDAATQAHGLAAPFGLIGHTGVGGLTLGGGMGWLTRKHGLSVDNLLAAEVALADGRIVRAAADENTDLFWALRGGGGNFGVVTSFEFQLHEVDPMVQFGLFFWPLEQGAEALRLAREVVGTLPPELNAIVGAVNAPPAPFVPDEFHFRPGFVLLLTDFGSAEEHAAVTSRIRAELPPLFDFITPMPYVQLQQLLDEANAWGNYCYEKGCYVEDLSDPVIEAFTEHVPRKASPMSAVLCYRLDGAYARVGDDDTAFSGQRTPRYGVFVIGFAPNAELLAPERQWTRAFDAALRPHTLGNGGYINAISDSPADHIRASYGDAKYQRLAEIKATYDPGNVFHLNANILPSP